MIVIWIVISAAAFSARLQRVMQPITHFSLLQELRLFLFNWRFWDQFTYFIETFSIQRGIFLYIFLNRWMHMAIACLMLNLITLGFKHISFFFPCFFNSFSKHWSSVILIIIFGYRHRLSLIRLIFNLTY